MNLKAMTTLVLAGVLFAIPAAAQQEEGFVVGGDVQMGPMPPPPPPVPGHPMMLSPPSHSMMMALPPPSHGIPARMVEKLGLSKDLVQRIQDLTFEANGQLITLEADLKRAQLELDKLLRAANPSDNTVMQQVEAVGRAETAMRKNRIGLMLQIKRLLGPDNWQKLEAEMGEMRRDVRIMRPPGLEMGRTRVPEPRK